MQFLVLSCLLQDLFERGWRERERERGTVAVEEGRRGAVAVMEGKGRRCG
jgi:hypothetical protein